MCMHIMLKQFQNYRGDYMYRVTLANLEGQNLLYFLTFCGGELSIWLLQNELFYFFLNKSNIYVLQENQKM